MFDLYEKAGIELDIKNLNIESVNSADLLAHALTQSTMSSYFKEQEYYFSISILLLDRMMKMVKKSMRMVNMYSMLNLLSSLMLPHYQ